MEINRVTNNIKKLRFINGEISQQMLADLVGCTRQTINSLEKDKYSLSYLLVCKIAKIFNVKPDEVIVIDFK